MKRLISTGLVLLALIAAPRGQAQSNTGTTTVSVTVGAEASLVVNTATTTMATTGTLFNDYTGSTGLTYKIRTGNASGTGAITLEVTSDFSGAGGPSVTTPPTAGDALTYSCSAAAPATACGSTQTASTSSATSVATFGADAHSTKSGNSASVGWTLTNDPVYKTGSYNATVTFTISATYPCTRGPFRFRC